MLTDIAQGIGAAARTVVVESRSDIGGLAVKGAKVEVEFEMASHASAEGVSAGLGVRTFSFGFGVNKEAVDERRTNRGRIELEIVAVPVGTAAPTEVTPAPAPAPVADPGPGPKVDAGARMKQALAALWDQLSGARIPATVRARAEKQLTEAEKLIDKGDLAKATAALVQLQPLVARIAGGKA
jgi:hypothetical protein